MPRLKIIVVAGARPNFMKVAPLLKALGRRRAIETLFVHTGQHYDFKMSEVFFKDLNIPKPDIYLNVGSGTHAAQTAKILRAFEPVLAKEKPALLIVVGDVNSTLACSLAASKLHVPVAHVEAGLRSFDSHMPEEINRIATDHISDYLFVTEKSGLKNLKKEGIPSSKVFFVGNVMIDTLLSSRAAISRSRSAEKLKLQKGKYAVATLHRPSNVDSKASLVKFASIFKKLCAKTTVVFPVHPRTRSQIKRFGLDSQYKKIKGLMLTEPLGYVDFIRLVRDAQFILTDSGGIQEEATVLGVPCLTLRENTERPSTLNEGTNILVGQDTRKIFSSVDGILSGRRKKTRIPRFWDGRSAERIAGILEKKLVKR